jgi:hypothetical protein
LENYFDETTFIYFNYTKSENYLFGKLFLEKLFIENYFWKTILMKQLLFILITLKVKIIYLENYF